MVSIASRVARREVTFKALVLAAGHGQRLRPLTATIPKPLLPVAGEAVAASTLTTLAEAGCSAAALNLHHLGASLPLALGDSWAGMPLVYSEEPELLGTLGALTPLRQFFSDCDFGVLINGDSLCRWPLRSLIGKHLRSRAAATLLLSQRAEVERHGGGIAIADDGRVVQFRRSGPQRGTAVAHFVFAGAHILSRDLLDHIPHERQAADIVGDLYQPMLASGAIFQTLQTRVRWFDLGTPQRYLEGATDFGRGRAPLRWLRRNWVSPQARIEAKVRLRSAVVEAGATVGAGASLDNVLVLDGALIGAGSSLRGVIVGPHVELPAGSCIEQRMVTPLSSGRNGKANDSVLGQLVFTPIDR